MSPFPFPCHHQQSAAAYSTAFLQEGLTMSLCQQLEFRQNRGFSLWGVWWKSGDVFIQRISAGSPRPGRYFLLEGIHSETSICNARTTHTSLLPPPRGRLFQQLGENPEHLMDLYVPPGSQQRLLSKYFRIFVFHHFISLGGEKNIITWLSCIRSAITKQDIQPVHLSDYFFNQANPKSQQTCQQCALGSVGMNQSKAKGRLTQ